MTRQHPRRKTVQTAPAFGLLFEKNPLPMWIYDIKTLAFLAVNQTAIIKYGYSREEFLNMTIKDIRPAEDVAVLEVNLDRKRPVLQHSGEWRHCSKNGHLFSVQIDSCLLKYRGREAVFVIARDISQERKARDEVFALWRQHLQLQEIINQSPAIALMWGVGTGWPVSFVSENIVQFGYIPEQFTSEGLLYSDIVHPEDLHDALDAIQHFTNRNYSQFIHEYRILTVDRQVRWVEDRTWVHRANNGQVLGYSGIVLDITDRKKAEEDLRYQAALMKNVSDAIISTDMAFNILSWNLAAEEIYQWKAQDVIGKRWHALAETHYFGQDESDVLRQFSSVGYWDGIVSQKRKDGQRLTIDARMSMIKDSKGQPIGIVVAQRDITEKIKIEQALINSEKQYRAIFEQAAVGVSRTSIDGYFLDVNEKFCQITGFSRKELLGRSFVEITYPGDIDSNNQLRQDLLVDKKLTVTAEKRYIRKDGSRIWVNLTLSYVESGPELEPFFLAITEDINARKIHERDLQALYESGLVLIHLKTAQEIASKIIEILNNHLAWFHAGVWLRDKDTDDIRILTYSVPEDETDTGEEREKSQAMVHNINTGMTGRAMRLGQTIRSGNVTADPHYLFVHDGIQSGLYVPLISGGRAIGCIMVESHDPEAFSEEDQRLLETLANQATIAFENATLLETEKERSNQMLAVIQASQAISGTLDLRTLLDTIIKTAQKAIPATERGSIFLKFEDGSLHISGSMGYYDPRFLNHAFSDQIGYAAQSYREQKSLFIADARQATGKEYFEDFFETKEILSAITAPLVIKGHSIGVISLDNCTRTSAFTENDLQLLSTFAASAAISIENARLFEQTNRRAEELTVLTEVSLAMRNANSQKTIIEVVFQKVESLFHVHHASFINFDKKKNGLVIEFAIGKWAYTIGEVLSASHSMAARVHTTGQFYLTTDLQSDPYVSRMDLIGGIHSNLGVPMVVNDKVIGSLWFGLDEIYDSGRRFTESDIHLLSALTDMAANAINRVNLLKQVQIRAENLDRINALGRKLTEPQQLDEIYRDICQAALALAPDSYSAALSLYDEQQKNIQDVCCIQEGKIQTIEAALPLSLALSQHKAQRMAIESANPVIVDDVAAGPSSEPTSGTPLISAMPSGVYLPLVTKGQVIGVLQLQSNIPGNYTQADAELLSLVANTAAVSIENSRLFQETQVRLQHISALRSIDNAINASADLSIVLNVILEQARAQLGVDAACILAFNPVTMNLEHQSSTGFFTETIRLSRFRIGEGLSARAILDQKTVLITDLQSHADSSSRENLLQQEGFVVYACTPMLAKGEVKGLLEVFHRSSLKTDSEWLSFFEMLGGQTAIAIENTQLYQNLQRSNLELTIAYDATIEGWAQALELRDQETEGHSRRVTGLALQLARQLGLRGDTLIQIRRGALLHDIGKMGIPDSILHKPGPLTPEEWIVMRKHPVKAYELLSQIPYLQHALEIPYCHHEKWDGSGYPRGLRGEQIPIAARIFAVIDVYDALTSDRPYRPALNLSDVLEYIRAQSGRHFDPAVAEAFLQIINNPNAQ